MDKKYAAFTDTKKIATGPLAEVALKVKEHLKKKDAAPVLIFDESTSAIVDLDLRGTNEDILKKLTVDSVESASAKVGPGRPKLGVISREITLLPQHWEWLARQPGGASVAIRKLVDSAQKKNLAKDQIRQSQDVTYKFMTAIAGDRPHYEEALRALYAQDKNKFRKQISTWPKDIQEHILKLGAAALSS